jgi:hypothetical protein
LCVVCLLTASLSLTFATTRKWSISQSAALNDWTSSVLECRLLSLNPPPKGYTEETILMDMVLHGSFLMPLFQRVTQRNNIDEYDIAWVCFEIIIELKQDKLKTVFISDAVHSSRKSGSMQHEDWIEQSTADSHSL